MRTYQMEKLQSRKPVVLSEPQTDCDAVRLVEAET